MIELNGKHTAILLTIGAEGAFVDDFGRELMSREFDELASAGLICFWPMGQPAPPRIMVTARRPGTWCLTLEGAAAIGFEGPYLRMSDAPEP